MAKTSKKNLERETRKFVETVSDLVKKKGSRYKFKAKKSKKTIKKVKQECPHWIIRNDKLSPTLVQDNEHPGYWRCTICGALFPINPMENHEYENMTDHFISYVDQMFFWAIKCGGDDRDTKMFIQLKRDANRFKKVVPHILKRMKAKDSLTKHDKRGAMNQFTPYGYNYNIKD